MTTNLKNYKNNMKNNTQYRCSSAIGHSSSVCKALGPAPHITELKNTV